MWKIAVYLVDERGPRQTVDNVCGGTASTIRVGVENDERLYLLLSSCMYRRGRVCLSVEASTTTMSGIKMHPYTSNHWTPMSGERIDRPDHRSMMDRS